MLEESEEPAGQKPDRQDIALLPVGGEPGRQPGQGQGEVEGEDEIEVVEVVVGVPVEQVLRRAPQKRPQRGGAPEGEHAEQLIEHAPGRQGRQQPQQVPGEQPPDGHVPGGIVHQRAAAQQEGRHRPAADAAVEGGSQPAVGPHAVVGKVAGAAVDEEHRADGQTLDQIHRAVPPGGSFSVHGNTSVILFLWEQRPKEKKFITGFSGIHPLWGSFSSPETAADPPGAGTPAPARTAPWPPRPGPRTSPPAAPCPPAP